MSYTNFSAKNKHKQNRHTTLSFNQYLYNAHEPQFDDIKGSLVKSEDMEQDDYYKIKRYFRVWPEA